MKFICSVTVILASFFFANSVYATSVTVAFEGRVTIPGIPGPSIGAVVDTPITGSFTYETTATPGPGSSPTFQTYTGAISDLSINVGTATLFEVNPLGFTDTLTVADNLTDQLFFTRTVTGPTVGGITPLSVEMSFNDPLGGALNSLSIPSAISPAFTNNQISIFFVGDDQFSVTQLFGVIDQVAPVPLPAAVWLFTSAIAGLVAVRRRQRSSGAT